MIPLSFVYIGEYLINQGVNQLIIFNCHEGFHLTLGAQYRWYQVDNAITIVPTYFIYRNMDMLCQSSCRVSY
ncbi:hypothetical protein OESDEN_24554 [Oesophagostomum dentatum]|uniref:Uncharacterized protein n=1 Tax=Oesophagostomum dentatum TaxID=61180 RepID=A0A0B1RRZ0_OESDE|nr:hypothetical protein OESDEN_24554 [Oesophagostomum dentatum]